MRITGEIKIITGAALFALIPVCVVLGRDLNVFSLLFGRLLVAVIILFLFEKNKKQLFKISLQEIGMLTFWSLFMLGAMISYFYAINYSSMAVSSALLGTHPLVIVLLAAFFLKEKISQRSIFAAIVTLVGILCITGVSEFSNTKYLVGELLAICSAILLGFNFIFQKKYLSKYSGTQLVFYQGLFQLPFLLPALFFNPGTLSNNAIVAIVLLGVVCTVMSYTLIYSGVKQVPAQKIGVLQSIEYVLPIIIGILFYNETQTTMAICGMVLVIVACLMVGTETTKEKLN